MVREHLSTNGKEYLTRDYVERLDTTLSHGVPIDLRSDEEKKVVENWKIRVQRLDEEGEGASEKDGK